MSTSGPCPASEVEFKKICEMVRSVKALGLETCVTLGFLTEAQATKLDESGLDYYNYSVDTSPEFYANIVSTRTVDDRINTIETEQKTGLHVPETLSAWEKAMKTESECLFCSRILPFRPDVCR